MHNKYYIFDFDGVLGDTFDGAVKTNSQFYNLTTENAIKVTRDFFDLPRLTSNQEKETVYQKSLSSLKQYNELYINILTQMNAKVFNTFLDIIIHKLDRTKLAIVSSGDKGYILPMLGDYSKYFDFILDVYDDKSKVSKVNFISQRWKVPLNSLSFFTDTKSDVIELNKLLPKKIYGCAWGYHGLEKLKEVLPKEKILVSFEDILKI